jgi:hypothetical protein
MTRIAKFAVLKLVGATGAKISLTCSTVFASKMLMNASPTVQLQLVALETVRMAGHVCLKEASACLNRSNLVDLLTVSGIAPCLKL